MRSDETINLVEADDGSIVIVVIIVIGRMGNGIIGVLHSLITCYLDIGLLNCYIDRTWIKLQITRTFFPLLIKTPTSLVSIYSRVLAVLKIQQQFIYLLLIFVGT